MRIKHHNNMIQYVSEVADDRGYSQILLQKFISYFLFNRVIHDCWYTSKGYDAQDPKDTRTPFEVFMARQQQDPNAKFHHCFDNLEIIERQVPTCNAYGDSMMLEAAMLCPTVEPDIKQTLPGHGQHIIEFNAANVCFQSGFRYASKKARKTGASIHLFNYPGVAASTGGVQESAGLINAGIAMVNDLLKQGVNPEDIILQGSCLGSAVAQGVRDQFERQANIKLRVILCNPFTTFSEAVEDIINDLWFVPNFLAHVAKQLIRFCGWDYQISNSYQFSDPYSLCIQNEDDNVLHSARLRNQLDQNLVLADQGTLVDPCPEEYKSTRTKLRRKALVHIKQEKQETLAEKHGRAKDGRADGHAVSLGDCVTKDNNDIIDDLINPYIKASNNYIDNHPAQDEPTVSNFGLRDGDVVIDRVMQGEVVTLQGQGNRRNDNAQVFHNSVTNSV